LSERTYTVYMMASQRNGTLYIGVTNNLALRAHQHRTGVGSTFTTKYGVKMLVWYETYGDVNQAIAREKQLKKWERKWKLARLVRDAQRLNAASPRPVWMPACAGMTKMAAMSPAYAPAARRSMRRPVNPAAGSLDQPGLVHPR
jgi:putative endonuclease